jgi:hypothetical protein
MRMHASSSNLRLSHFLVRLLILTVELSPLMLDSFFCFRGEMHLEFESDAGARQPHTM